MKTLLLKDNFIINADTTKDLLSSKFNCPGVYVLYNDDKDISSTLSFAKQIYVGKSKNIHSRIKNHTVKLPKVLYIGLFDNPSQGLIDACEDVLIKIIKQQSKHMDYTILNTEQVTAEIDVFLALHEYKTLKDVIESFLDASGVHVSAADIEAMCLKHKPSDTIELSTRLNLNIDKGYTFRKYVMPMYDKTETLTLDLRDENNLIEIEYTGLAYEDVEYHEYNNYYIFLTDEDLLFIKQHKLYDKMSLNHQYIHISDSKIINGSDKYNIKHLSLALWKKQSFSTEDLISDGILDYDKISKSEICPMSLEEFMF